ncbi:MAG: hypothetical protein Q8J65_10195 [Nitrosomonadales bacterium]|nr:hypothetical protein [Nitrosomonadales bacterium]
MRETDPQIQDILNRLADISGKLSSSNPPTEISSNKAELNTNHQKRSAIKTSLSVITNLSRSPQYNAKQQLIKWFENTNALNQTELKRLKRLALFDVAPNGEVRIKPAPVSTSISNLLLALIIGIAGIWAGWILFTASAGLELIIQSIGIGMALGGIARFVLDISYRHHNLYEKLSMLAPILRR